MLQKISFCAVKDGILFRVMFHAVFPVAFNAIYICILLILFSQLIIFMNPYLMIKLC